VHITSAFGSGKTQALMLAIWQMLDEEDTANDDDVDVFLTDSELDSVVGAVKSRSVDPLPAEIENLSDSSRFLQEAPTKKDESAPVPRKERKPHIENSPVVRRKHDRKLMTMPDFEAIRYVEKSMRRDGVVEDLGLYSRYLRDRYARAVRLTLAEFYEHYGADREHAAAYAGLEESWARFYENALERWAPYRRARECLDEYFAYELPSDWWTPACSDFRWRTVESVHRGSEQRPFKRRSPQDELPDYLVALVVTGTVSRDQDQEHMPVWLTCSENSVTPSASPAGWTGGRWHMVISVSPGCDLTEARRLAVRPVVLRLPAHVKPDRPGSEAVRTHWEESWRPHVFKLLEGKI
jgi:hypothetical protein